MSNTIIGSLEILTSILSNSLNSDAVEDEIMADLKADPSGFVHRNFNLSIDNVAVVQNSADKIHLALPYYKAVDVATAETMNEDEMSQASGGEIFAVFVPSIILATVATGIVANDIVKLKSGTLEGTVLPWREIAKKKASK